MRTGKAPKTVDEYLAIVPEPARSTLVKVRATIRAAAPAGATESISYGMPMFKYQACWWGLPRYEALQPFPGAGPIARVAG